MPPVSVSSLANGTHPYDCAFLRAARGFVHYRPHLNPCSGGDRFRRAKLDGERPMSYPDVCRLVMSARKEGAKHGLGAEMVAALMTAIVADTLATGTTPDVEVRIVAPDPEAVSSQPDEGLKLHIAHSQLVAAVTEALADDGAVDIGEARTIHHHSTEMSRRLRRFLAATFQSSQPRQQVRA